MTEIDPIDPPAEAIDEAKAYLRIDGTPEDATIGRMIAAAIGHAEAFTGQVLIARAIEETMPARACAERLSRTPVTAIAGVDALSVGTPPSTLDPDQYAVEIDAAGDGWMRLTSPTGTMRVRVRYSAGMAAGWAGLPEPIRQGVIRLASHFFTHRDSADEGVPPAAVAALWRPWRRMRLA